MQIWLWVLILLAWKDGKLRRNIEDRRIVETRLQGLGKVLLGEKCAIMDSLTLQFKHVNAEFYFSNSLKYSQLNPELIWQQKATTVWLCHFLILTNYLRPFTTSLSISRRNTSRMNQWETKRVHSVESCNRNSNEDILHVSTYWLLY